MRKLEVFASVVPVVDAASGLIFFGIGIVIMLVLSKPWRSW